MREDIEDVSRASISQGSKEYSFRVSETEDLKNSPFGSETVIVSSSISSESGILSGGFRLRLRIALSPCTAYIVLVHGSQSKNRMIPCDGCSTT